MTTQFTITNPAGSANNIAVSNPANPSQVRLIQPGQSANFTAAANSSWSITEGGSANTGPALPPVSADA